MWKVIVKPQYSGKGRRWNWKFFGVFDSQEIAKKEVTKAMKKGYLFDEIYLTNIIK